MKNMKLGLAATALLLSALQAQPVQATAARGRVIVQDNCSRCHAIGRTGKSPLAKAPPLRIIAKKYPLENLEEAFAEGIVVSHNAPEMPPFEMEPGAIADLLDYLKTLRPKKR